MRGFASKFVNRQVKKFLAKGPGDSEQPPSQKISGVAKMTSFSMWGPTSGNSAEI